MSSAEKKPCACKHDHHHKRPETPPPALVPQSTFFGLGMSRRLVGVLSLVSVVLLWTASGRAIKFLLGDGHHLGPVFMTFYQQAHGIVMLLPLVVQSWLSKKGSKTSAPKDQGVSLEEGKSIAKDISGALRFPTIKEVLNAVPPSKILIFSLIWLAAQGTFNASLAPFFGMRFSTQTTLSNCSSAFTFLIGVAFFRQRFRWVSAAGVVAAITGAYLIVAKEKGGFGSATDTLSGSAMTLGSAALGGLTSCLMNAWLKDERHINVLIGLIGVVSVFLAPIIISIAHFSGVENFQFPETSAIWLMSLNAVLGTVLSNYLYSVAVTILGALTVSVGVATTVPVSLILDVIEKQKTEFNSLYVFGLLLIIVAVTVVAYDQTKAEKDVA